MSNAAKINWVLLAIIIALLVTMSLGMSHYKRQLNISEGNIRVMQDSMKTLTLKNGDQASTTGSYVLKKEQLTEYLDISKKEIRDIERKLGDIAYISNIDATIKYDTIRTMDTVFIKGDTTMFHIDIDDEWLKVAGTAFLHDDIAETTLNNVEVPCPLRVGLTDEYRIWVEAKNPYMKITDIEGAVIDGSKLHERKKRWNIGLQVGFGAQYSIIHKKFDIGPYVGVGISYGWDF